MRRSLLRLLGIVLCAGLGVYTPLAAQTGPLETSGAVDRQPWLLWTRPSTQDRLLWGQWTRHIDSERRPGVSNDGLFAIVYRGYFAGTFETSHDHRAYAVGLERAWATTGGEAAGVMVGFRAGLVYGYDEQLGWLAGAVPILPFASSLAQVWIGPLSAEVSHTWVVVSVGAAVRF